jgi:ectoine hydroxylase-related dioxygenase (phytanoyl-CoA dioxygenase family)
MSGGIVRTLHPDDAIDCAEELAATFRRYGALILPGFLASDEAFQAQKADLERIVDQLLERESGGALHASSSFDERLASLASRNRRRPGLLDELASRQAKLVSASMVRVHPAVLALVRAIFGERALLSSPPEGDQLEISPPAAECFRAAPPIHQDYPRLMQSPAMLTAWLNFGKAHPDAGGITLWPGSHQLGILPQRRTAGGPLEVLPTEEQLAAFEPVDLVADVGDLVFLDALLWTRATRNLSRDRARVVQVFHYSDLAHPVAVRQQRLATGGRGLTFEQAHPELLTG